MKLFTTLLVGIISLAFFTGCNTDGGMPQVKGKIENSSNIQIFLDKVSLSSASNVVAKSDIGSNGEFSIPVEAGFEPGVYRLRVGAKKLLLIMDGSEETIKINADLNNLEDYSGTVEGSPASSEFFEAMEKLKKRELNAESAKVAVENMESPIAAMMFAYTAFGKSPDFVDVHKGVKEKLGSKYVGASFVDDYNNLIMQVDAQKMLSQRSGPIELGMEAPDISLPSPDGKVYSLSDLKGKVVLLDFWASWCGPCRRENPNVVRVYDKYNSKGFEVFSVSLDREGAKDRWVQAIKADNLKWKYHVSDLQFWNSAPAKLYGVNSIPRTFLIDKDGKIAAINLRGAEAIEQELKKLL